MRASDSLWPSDVNVNFNYMRDCLLNQSEANGPRRDHVTFATLVNVGFSTVTPTRERGSNCVRILGFSDVY